MCSLETEGLRCAGATSARSIVEEVPRSSESDRTHSRTSESRTLT
jgi:hypothetical protein